MVKLPYRTFDILQYVAKQSDYDIYCEDILSNKIKVKKIYESKMVLAFYHTNPSSKTHIIIIPKKHVHNLIDANPEVLAEIMKVSQKILRKIDVDTDGGKLVTGLGKSQKTPHLHFHITSDGENPNIKLD